LEAGSSGFERNTIMIQIVDLIGALLDGFLAKTKSQLPVTVVDAVQAAIDALAAHKDDLLTKENFEAQRG
jgi:hypothetical protein